MVNYEPLWEMLKKRGITTYMLINKFGFNARTINNLKHNKGITVDTLERLCKVLDCTPNDILLFVESENK